MKDDPMDGLAKVRDRIDTLQREVDDLVVSRQKLVRDALSGGVPVAQIVQSAGLSRARVYQIRDGR